MLPHTNISVISYFLFIIISSLEKGEAACFKNPCICYKGKYLCVFNKNGCNIWYILFIEYIYKLLLSLLFSDPKFKCKRAKEEQNDFSPLILSPITGVIEQTNKPELWGQNYVSAQRCFVIEKKKHTRCSATSIYKQYLKVIVQKQIFRKSSDGFHFLHPPKLLTWMNHMMTRLSPVYFAAQVLYRFSMWRLRLQDAILGR